MEDTGWPYSSLDDYIKCWDELYYQPAVRTPAVTIDVQACFQNAHGTGQRREAMLWQKISPRTSARLCICSRRIWRPRRGPGTYMFDSLKFRDQWESKLLRTSAWSPLY